MVAGKDAPSFGEAKNSWLTGTAAWTFLCISQEILGIRPTLDGLSIDPSIPSSLNGFTVIRRYRGAKYEITVENPDHVQHGVRELYVNGEKLTPVTAADGEKMYILSPAPAGETVEVRVFMG